MTKRPRFSPPTTRAPVLGARAEAVHMAIRCPAVPVSPILLCLPILFTLCAPHTLCNPSEAEHSSKLRSPSKLCSRIRKPQHRTARAFYAPCQERPPRSASGSSGPVHFTIAASLGIGSRTNVSRPAGQPHVSIACRQLSRITTSDISVFSDPQNSQKVCRVFNACF